MKTKITRNLPKRFGFLLLNDFTLISFSSAVEPLRMANRICRKDIYSWRTLSITGEAVTASDGVSVNVDCAMDNKNALNDLDAIIVCTGRRVEKNSNKPLSLLLKSISLKGVDLGAICTGSYILAEAGLLDGYRCSVHWENMAAMTSLFPEVVVSRNVFTIDRNRYTSSGGTTPVDMMLHFIRDECGTEVSVGVAEQFIYERIRRTEDKQRIPLRHVMGHQSEKLVVAIELMEANIREPIRQVELAEFVGLSIRQLQRLFQRYLSCTPTRYYLQIRLIRARELLRQTSFCLEEVSASTGFVSRSHFSKSYKDVYGYPPNNERRHEIAETRDALLR